MDEAAPLTWLIGRITDIVTAGAADAATALVSTITPLVSVCFGIYILLITVNYMRGAETEPVLDFGMRCAGFAIVIGIGLTAKNYIDIVIPIVTGLGGDLAAAVSGGTVSAATLDNLALWYLKIIADGYEAVDAMPFPANLGASFTVSMKTVIICIGLIPFLVAATLAIVVANVGSTIVAIVGPIFFACLLFPTTRQYFSSWVNTAFSYALIPLFVAVIAVVSVGISKEMLSAGGTLAEASFKSVFLAAMGNLTLLFLLRQISGLASSLSAGGINAAMPGSIGTLAHSMRSGVAGTVRELRGADRVAGRAYAGAERLKTAIANRMNSIRKAG